MDRFLFIMWVINAGMWGFMAVWPRQTRTLTEQRLERVITAFLCALLAYKAYLDMQAGVG